MSAGASLKEAAGIAGEHLVQSFPAHAAGFQQGKDPAVDKGEVHFLMAAVAGFFLLPAAPEAQAGICISVLWMARLRLMKR